MGLVDPNNQETPSAADKDPATFTQDKLNPLKVKWDELNQFFESVPPPDECRPIANDYGRALSEVPGMLSDLLDILSLSSSNPDLALEQAGKMTKKSNAGVDSFFTEADRKLGQICEKYARAKWFDISSDIPASGLLSKQMIGGLGGLPGGNP
jgi:hypothetical protein